MALNASSLKSAMKSAVDAIDVNNGEVANDQALQALATAIVDEIQANAQVIIAGGSSAGTYSVL